VLLKWKRRSKRESDTKYGAIYGEIHEFVHGNNADKRACVKDRKVHESNFSEQKLFMSSIFYPVCFTIFHPHIKVCHASPPPPSSSRERDERGER
jgi:hypothetical protein